MGAGYSIPSTLTREKVFQLTQSTRGTMDVILDYMLKEITVRDFLALSNPTECKKYVIFMANTLNSLFYELKIVPTKDKRGILAFRPVKDLINPTGELDLEKQSLCLTIAYFYTRIFQIYGALALTLIDDSRLMMDSGLIPFYQEKARKGLQAPGYRPFTTTGGAIPAASLGNFNFLRNFLYEDRDSTKGFLTKYTGEDESRGVVYFLPRIQERDEFGRPIQPDMYETSIQKGIFYIGYTGGKKYAMLEVYARIDAIGGDTRFTFGKFKYYKKDAINPDTIDLSSSIIPQKNITIERERPAGLMTYTYKIKGTGKSISEYFNDDLNNIVIYLRRLTEGSTSGITTSGVIISETGTTEELRLARIVQNLTKTKPLGHCLARALQLLQNVPLKGEPIVSSICKAKFMEQTTISSSGVRTTTSRSGIPEPGASLDTSPGLSALAQLFYDTVLVSTPKIVIGTQPGPNGEPSSLQQYIDFMKKMGRLFGDNTFSTGTPSDEAIKYGLKGIYNRRDKVLCGATTDKILLPPNEVGGIYSVVNSLYKIQVEHAAKCGKIINLLFNIERDKSSLRYKISLSNNIIEKGFTEINRINYLAREVLVNYYSSCESKYLEGMKIVLEAKNRVTPTRT